MGNSRILDYASHLIGNKLSLTEQYVYVYPLLPEIEILYLLNNNYKIISTPNNAGQRYLND